MELSEKWSCPKNGVVRKMELSEKWSCPKMEMSGKLKRSYSHSEKIVALEAGQGPRPTQAYYIHP